MQPIELPQPNFNNSTIQWKLLIPAIVVAVLIFGLLGTASAQPTVGWTNTLGGHGEEVGRAIAPNPDGGYLITGSTTSIDGSEDIYYAAIDDHGNELYGFAISGIGDDAGYDIASQPVGFSVVAGSIQQFPDHDAAAISFGPGGIYFGVQTFGAEGDDAFYATDALPNGGFLLAGVRENVSTGMQEGFVVRLNVALNPTLELGVPADGNVVFQAVRGTHDEGVIAGGYVQTGVNKSSRDAFLVRMNEFGSTLWTAVLGEDGVADEINDIVVNADGGFTATGTRGDAIFGEPDIALWRVDHDGNPMFARTFGNDDREDVGKSLFHTQDGGFFVAGTRVYEDDNDIFFLVTDTNGNREFGTRFGLATSNEEAHDFIRDGMMGVVFVGTTDATYNGPTDILVGRAFADSTGSGGGGGGGGDGDPDPTPMFTVNLTPDNPAIFGPDGGLLTWGFTIANDGSLPATVDVWTEAELSNGNTLGPLLMLPDLTFFPGATVNGSDLGQPVPDNAPVGLHYLRLKVGQYPDNVIAEDWVFVVVLPVGAAVEGGSFAGKAAGGSVATLTGEDGIRVLPFGNARQSELTPAPLGWESSRGRIVLNGEPLAGIASDGLAATAVPREFALAAAYPNPFNPSTTVSLSLPNATDLRITVYNTLGQQVAELANARFNAGSHKFTFTAGPELASGVYVVRADAAGFGTRTQKLMLLR